MTQTLTVFKSFRANSREPRAPTISVEVSAYPFILLSLFLSNCLSHCCTSSLFHTHVITWGFCLSIYLTILVSFKLSIPLFHFLYIVMLKLSVEVSVYPLLLPSFHSFVCCTVQCLSSCFTSCLTSCSWYQLRFLCILLYDCLSLCLLNSLSQSRFLTVVVLMLTVEVSVNPFLLLSFCPFVCCTVQCLPRCYTSCLSCSHYQLRFLSILYSYCLFVLSSIVLSCVYPAVELFILFS